MNMQKKSIAYLLIVSFFCFMMNFYSISLVDAKGSSSSSSSSSGGRSSSSSSVSRSSSSSAKMTSSTRSTSTSFKSSATNKAYKTSNSASTGKSYSNSTSKNTSQSRYNTTTVLARPPTQSKTSSSFSNTRYSYGTSRGSYNTGLSTSYRSPTYNPKSIYYRADQERYRYYSSPFNMYMMSQVVRNRPAGLTDNLIKSSDYLIEHNNYINYTSACQYLNLPLAYLELLQQAMISKNNH